MNRIGSLLLVAAFSTMVLAAAGELQIACENSQVVLRCPIGYNINILHANYGRSQPGKIVCSHSNIKTTNCHSENSRQITMESCNGKQICHLSASNDIFGDPCVGTHKYLDVVYLCV